MNYLVVVAHPDDEVLGAGATIFKYTRNNNVDICIMSSEVKARTFKPEDNVLVANQNTSAKLLGINQRYEGFFPNIEMNTVPHLKLVQFIENAIIKSKPDIVITHHPSDLNNDHLHTSLACQAAMRLFQRKKDLKPINELWYMEIPSATDWALNSAMNRFSPNTYVEIGEDSLHAKVKALSIYQGVMRDYPHPRSYEVLRGLAAFRGGQAGLVFAEAFECVFRRVI